jgi:hypothetical protein
VVWDYSYKVVICFVCGLVASDPVGGCWRPSGLFADDPVDWLLVKLERNKRRKLMNDLVGTLVEQRERIVSDFWPDRFADLSRQQEEQQPGQSGKFWKNHSVFQVPARVVSFKGSSESLILLYLYKLANAVHLHCPDEVQIELTVKEETIVAKTGLSTRAVSKAIRILEAAEYVRVIRRRDPATKRVSTSVYLLLHTETKEPLRAFPKRFGVCHSNGSRPYITVPQEAREILNKMHASGRAVYLSALLIGSRSMRMHLYITRNLFQDQSLLAVNGFCRGLKDCKKRGLLSYKRSVLILNDPVTGKPSERFKYADRIEHAKPHWKFDLDTVTAEQWQRILEHFLPGLPEGGHNGWTRTSLQVRCPLCHEDRTFAVNTKTARYSCQSEKCGHGGKGRLAQLVHRIRGFSKMSHTKQYIQNCVNDMNAPTI